MSSWTEIARRIRVPVGFAFAALYFWLAHPRLWSLALGVGIAILGLVIRTIASGHVRKNETLVTTGPYAYVRNPLYLGSLVIAAGFALAALDIWIVVVMLIMFFVIYLPVIRSEEAFLSQQFPEFNQYELNVPRLVPRLTPYGNARGAFSWDLYRKHREYNAVLGAMAMIAGVAIKMIWFTK